MAAAQACKSSISPDTNVKRAALHDCRKNEEGAKKNRAERKEDRGDDMGNCTKYPKSRTKQKPVASNTSYYHQQGPSAPPGVVLGNERLEGVPRMTSQGNPPRPSPPSQPSLSVVGIASTNPHEEAVLRRRGSHPTRASASTQRARWQGISDNKRTTGRARGTQSHAGWLLNH